MPTAGQWTKFLSGVTAIVGSGVVFVKYFTPTDEQFIAQLSPELRAEVRRQEAVRARAGQLMAERVRSTRDKPAWLDSMAAMRQQEYELLEQARRELEGEGEQRADAAERERLRQLALRERR